MNRTLLFVPAHKPDLYEKAMRTEADCLIFDLEDSVPGEENKQKARKILQQKISSGNFCTKNIWVRVNQFGTIDYVEDLKSIMGLNVNCILHPKVENRFSFDSAVKLKYDHNICCESAALIESTVGVCNVEKIARSCFVAALVFGNEDYETDLQNMKVASIDSLLYPRSKIALAARANGIDAIDTVTIGFRDKLHLMKHLSSSAEIGFNGKLCLHPSEIEVVNQTYSPTDSMVKFSKQIVEIYESSVNEGHGVSLIDGIFVGPPMFKKALRIMEIVEARKKCES